MAGISRGRTESLRHRSQLPLERPAPFVFIRDPASEQRDALRLAGLLVLTPWPKRIGVAAEAGHPEIVAAVVRRLLADRAEIGQACWVEPEKVTPATFAFDWLRRRMADHSTLAVRLADEGAGEQAYDGLSTSRSWVVCGRLEPDRAA